MAVAKLLPHLRNEHALHRWDIAGDDETSAQMLGQLTQPQLARLQALLSGY